MPTVTALSQSQINEKLKALPQWKLANNALERVEKFPNYLDAVGFVYKLGHEAEQADHHPDIIMNYKTVTIQFSTHSAGGITELDFKMAHIAEKLIAAAGQV